MKRPKTAPRRPNTPQVAKNLQDASTQDALGTVTILVNNAGIPDAQRAHKMDIDLIDRVLDINVRAPWVLSCEVARRLMAADKPGRIVNIGSIVGVVANAGQANYAASKAGLIGFTKSLAKELGGRGVTVNLVAPGFIETDMTAGLPEDIQASAKQNIPLGRFGSPEDIAATVQFLCSDAASYITGQVLMVDGGMAI